MALEVILLTYLLFTMGSITAVALYTTVRYKKFEPTSSLYQIFKCEKCNFVYTDDADVDRSRCPQCGLINEAIHF